MAFGEQAWTDFLPSYLSSESKGRLQQAIEQFHPSNREDISYEDFYKDYAYDYFLQGDIILDVRTANWNQDQRLYDKSYIEGLILSNTCDISLGNNRNVNPKQCLFAPLLKLDDYLADLLANGYSQQKVDEFKKNVKAQFCSNIFYLPAVREGEPERIALLDQIFWYPIEELASLVETINEERIASLNQYGFYLLVFKLSYHFCRLPEACDREI